MFTDLASRCLLDSTPRQYWKKTMFLSISIPKGANTVEEFSQKAWREKEPVIWDQSRTGTPRKEQKLEALIPYACKNKWGDGEPRLPCSRWKRRGSTRDSLSPHCLAPLATALSWLSRSSLVDTVYSAQPHTEIGTGKAENGWGWPEQVKTSAQCDGPSGLSVPVDSWNQS